MWVQVLTAVATGENPVACTSSGADSDVVVVPVHSDTADDPDPPERTEAGPEA